MNSDDNTIYIVNEDGEAKPISDFLGVFDNCEVTLSVNESIDLA